MLISTASVGSVLAAALGVMVFWSNPRRPVNRAVCFCSLNCVAWLASLHMAAFAGGGLPWIRVASAVAAFLPFHGWIVNEAIAGNWGTRDRKRVGLTVGWLAFSAALAADCFTGYFVPSYSTPHRRVFGVGYYAYILGTVASYAATLWLTFRNARRLTGGKRMELQVWLFGGCSVALAILVTMMANALTHHHVYIAIQPLLVIAFLIGASLVITTRRIFDAGQIFRIVLSRLILTGAIVGAAYGAFILTAPFVPASVAVFPAICVAFVAGPVLKGILDRSFDFYPQAKAARAAAFEAAQSDARLENIEPRFLEILRGWGQTEHAVVLTEDPDPRPGDAMAEGGPTFAALHRLGWVTPERLVREKAVAEAPLLSEFLDKNRLGIAVYSGSPRFNLVVGVGVPVSRRPFTYPQVTQLQELAAIVESAYERRVLAMRIQHTEQLATVGILGASLAHEIRNPLVSVKAIVQLLPTRYEEAAFRDKFFRLIGDEVGRIDRLTEQLLNLASPRVYTARPIELHNVVRSALELVTPRALDKHVRVDVELNASPDAAFSDPAAVTQVLLNLCFNAIQALDHTPSDRRVTVSTANRGRTIELAVADNGPGMTPQVYARLFRPFQTTKSSGFGLGLAICRDILLNLKAGITVDPPAPGRGATFRVTFPCPPSSS